MAERRAVSNGHSPRPTRGGSRASRRTSWTCEADAARGDLAVALVGTDREGTAEITKSTEDKRFVLFALSSVISVLSVVQLLGCPNSHS